MRYDPARPVAVFLGPSLDLASARARLDANYYPPVRMGDVYRLLATGVETIAIIDGVFHRTTPVWQREILAALEEGIHVVGGASMGALRAAELAPYGMLGLGTVYQWYRDGLIDGDDEVALLHGDGTRGYAALSEALVNVRFNLQRARRRGLVTEHEHEHLIAFAQRQYFGQRSWSGLVQSAPFQSIERARRHALAAFIEHERCDVKQADALAVIEHCRDRPGAPGRAAPTAPWSYPGTLRERLQCAVAPGGELVSGERLLVAIAADASWIERHTRDAASRFFLLRWLEPRAVAPDANVLARERARWRAATVRGDEAAWRRANGITARELDAELDARARCAWLREQTPRRFGLEFAAEERTLEPFAAADGTDPRAASREAAARAFLADWAAGQGIAVPAGLAEQAAAAWERDRGIACPRAWRARHRVTQADYQAIWARRALAEWLLARGPAHFGYQTWSQETALLRELQLAGAAAGLAARLAADPAPARAAGDLP